MATTRACGSCVRGVGLELDALLEVDQVELDLVGAVAQGQVGDQHVQQGRLARAGLAGDQHVLRGALAELEVLQLRRAGAAERHVDAARGCRRSTTRSGVGAMNSNGTSTRLRVLGRAADLCGAICVNVVGRRRASSVSGQLAEIARRSQTNRCPVPGAGRRSAGSRSASWKPCGQRQLRVDADQREHAAAGRRWRRC